MKMKRKNILGFVHLTRWQRMVSLCALVVLVLLLAPPSGSGQTLSEKFTVEGKARIVDGDTLEIGIHRVELYGIDAPEPEQRCERGGRPWPCGLEATYAMAALIETHWLTCRRRGTDGAGHMLADCRVGGPKGISINQEIVRRGWALAVRPPSENYVAAERVAKAAKVGLWSGTFVTPWEWRRTHETSNKVN